MRLLHAQSKTLKEFFNPIPPYAILSHTWEDEEVSFAALQNDPNHTRLAGYSKIAESCRLALEHDLEYVWVDTCCIDKSSSAELSEAINSMFKWYAGSARCFVCLSDVPSSDDILAKGSAFRQSRWWTRGWTLQELLAPSYHTFYASDWAFLSDIKMDYHSNTRVRKIWEREVAVNGIVAVVNETAGFDGFAGAHLDAPTVVKLSWASARQTSREEDIAYCLLGLLGVQMPLLYGEGKNAFRRLLDEVMKVDNSHDIFLAGYGVWASGTPKRISWGLLPESPALYRGVYKNVRKDRIPGRSLAHFTMTNAGLQVELPLIRLPALDIYLAVLDCTHRSGWEKWRIAIPLRRISEGSEDDNVYQRDENHGLVNVSGYAPYTDTFRQIYIQRNTTYTVSPIEDVCLPRALVLRELYNHGFYVLSMYPSSHYEHDAKQATINFPSIMPSAQFILMTSPRFKMNLVIQLNHDFDSKQFIHSFGKTEATSMLEILYMERNNLSIAREAAIDVGTNLYGHEVDRAVITKIAWANSTTFDSAAKEEPHKFSDLDLVDLAYEKLKVFCRISSPKTVSLGATLWNERPRGSNAQSHT